MEHTFNTMLTETHSRGYGRDDDGLTKIEKTQGTILFWVFQNLLLYLDGNSSEGSLPVQINRWI